MQKRHKDNPQVSEIMCKVCYCLQNVINEILTSYVLSHHSLVKDEKSFGFSSSFWAVFLSLKHENSIYVIFYRGLSCLTVNNVKSI